MYSSTLMAARRPLGYLFKPDPEEERERKRRKVRRQLRVIQQWRERHALPAPPTVVGPAVPAPAARQAQGPPASRQPARKPIDEDKPLRV